MGEEGFSFDSALLYHRYLPTALQAIEPVAVEPPNKVQSALEQLSARVRTRGVAA